MLRDLKQNKRVSTTNAYQQVAYTDHQVASEEALCWVFDVVLDLLVVEEGGPVAWGSRNAACLQLIDYTSLSLASI